MKIAIVIGSRADAPGQIAIANALAERGVEIEVHVTGEVYDESGDEHTRDSIPDWLQDSFPEYAFDGWGCDANHFWRTYSPWKDSPSCPDVGVLLGDRYEIVKTALDYRQAQVPIAHIHAGELTGQEPDDTYRDVISRMATWRFCPHTMAMRELDNGLAGCEWYNCNATFNCGSPFITSAHNTELIDVEWPKGDGPKVFVAFNPLPESLEETKSIEKAIGGIWGNVDPFRTVSIEPNSDRHRGSLEPWAWDTMLHNSLTHQEYLSYVATADVIVGNTSAGLIEATVWGTPYVCVGSRQKHRVAGENVIKCEPSEMLEKIEEALKMGRKPNNAYGDKDSAGKIADTLIKELNGTS